MVEEKKTNQESVESGEVIYFWIIAGEFLGDPRAPRKEILSLITNS